MKKIRRIALLTLAMLLATLALAEPEAGEYQTVPCPQQGFSTRCEAGMTWRWDSVYGLTITAGEALPCLMIRAMDGGGDFEGYFEGVLTPWLKARLGEDQLTVGDYAVYTLGEGIELPGVMYAFPDADGRRQMLFRLFDTRWERTVCYTLRYWEGEADDALRALGVAVSGFSMESGNAADGTDEPRDGAGLTGAGEIACPEQGFSARCAAAKAVRWQDGAGLYIYLGEAGELPYVLLNVEEGSLDIPAFFGKTATPWMRWRYGDDLVEVIDCGNLAVGERVMGGMGYRLRIGGEAVYALRLLENRGDCSVSYIAKFREDATADQQAALDALEALAGSLRLE